MLLVSQAQTSDSSFTSLIELSVNSFGTTSKIYPELKHLNNSTVKALTQFLSSFPLYYCTSLLAALPTSTLATRTLNTAARRTVSKHQSDHISLLTIPHRLLLSLRVTPFKSSLNTFSEHISCDSSAGASTSHLIEVLLHSPPYIFFFLHFTQEVWSLGALLPQITLQLYLGWIF